MFKSRRDGQLSEDVRRVVSDVMFLKELKKFFVLSLLAMMTGLICDVVDHRLRLGTNNAECCVTFLPVEAASRKCFVYML